jgi:hypothetical protein
VNDPQVSEILLLVDSPGGEGVGLPETATAIYDARKIKPVNAMVTGMAASAAYYLASSITLRSNLQGPFLRVVSAVRLGQGLHSAQAGGVLKVGARMSKALSRRIVYRCRLCASRKTPIYQIKAGLDC